MNFYKEAPTLKGTKITLRNINPENDNKGFFTMFLEPEMHVWTGNNIPNHENETYEILSKYRDLDGLIAWAIIDNHTQDFIGTYWIAPYQEGEKRFISAEAQRIGKSYWRKGYTKEARRLIYEFAFFTLNVEEIHAQAWKNNRNSCLSMESIGFHLHKSEKKPFPKRNDEFIENYYILTKANWINHQKEKQW